jgi:hypothetical protein
MALSQKDLDEIRRVVRGELERALAELRGVTRDRDEMLDSENDDSLRAAEERCRATMRRLMRLAKPRPRRRAQSRKTR